MNRRVARCGALPLPFLVAAALLALLITGAAAAPSHTPTLPHYRIPITADGLYRLSYETLAAAGVPVTGTPPSAFHLLWRGQEVALQEIDTADTTFDPGDGLLFYAEKFHGSVQDEKYTDENVYWLTVDPAAPGLRMDTRSVAPDGTGEPLAWYTATVRAEENLVYWGRWSDAPGTSTTWFWERVTTAGSPVTRTYPLTLTAPVPLPYTATLLLEVAGRSYNDDVSPDHHLRLAVNGTTAGEVAWDGQVGAVFTLPVTSTALVSGVNQVQVAVLTGLSAIQDIYVDRVEVAFRRALAAEEDRLAWTLPLSGSAAMTLTGLSTGTVHLYDVTHPLTPTRLVSATAFLSGTTYALALRDAAPAGTAYLAVAESAVAEAPTPTIYHPPADLLTPTVGADEIIVAPSEFITAVQPLADLRSAQGLRVRVVDVEDVYALFNGGVFHPEAIRAFVAHAYAHWPGPPPAYLLLVGDGHFNFKGHNPAAYGVPPPVWIPPYLAFADPWQGEVPVDSTYGDVDGDGMPEVMVGRIPAGSVAEVETAVDKILAYEADPAPPWRDRFLFVADNVPDDAGDFQGVVERLEALVPPWMERERVYLTDYCGPPVSPPQQCPSATLALTRTWSEGVALVTYAGHGSVNRWAHEKLLTPAGVPTFQPGHGLPFVLSLDCLDGYWMFPPGYPGLAETRSLAEALLLTPERGAVAVFAPAGLGTVGDEEVMAQAMYQAMFEENTFQLGSLTQAGREAISGSYLARTYTLFGDPAMRLAILPQRVFLPLVLRGF